ncbi:hypothetical protein, partial [Roseibium sp. RKSG952]|uniref:hypothetical protein n=1 Tax=Roseibium sp. RKSG952 TaxID=2529384 RepID=UPI001AD92023
MLSHDLAKTSQKPGRCTLPFVGWILFTDEFQNNGGDRVGSADGMPLKGQGCLRVVSAGAVALRLQFGNPVSFRTDEVRIPWHGNIVFLCGNKRISNP